MDIQEQLICKDITILFILQVLLSLQLVMEI